MLMRPSLVVNERDIAFSEGILHFFRFLFAPCFIWSEFDYCFRTGKSFFSAFALEEYVIEEV